MRGRTPGKAAVRLRAVTAHGAPIGVREATLRSMGGVVDKLLAPGRDHRRAVRALDAPASARRRPDRRHDRDPRPARVRAGPGAVVPGSARARGLRGHPRSDGDHVEQYTVVRSFLTRVATLAPNVRTAIAADLADRMALAIHHRAQPARRARGVPALCDGSLPAARRAGARAAGSLARVTAPALTYLDHAASAPMRPEAIEAMMPFLRGNTPTRRVRTASPGRPARRSTSRATASPRCSAAARTRSCSPGAAPRATTWRSPARSRRPAASRSARRSSTTRCCTSSSTTAARRRRRSRRPRRSRGARRDARRSDRRRRAGRRDRQRDGGEQRGRLGHRHRRGRRVVRRHAPGALFHTDAVQAACWLDLRAITPTSTSSR